jgi:hypothetical protein
MTAHRVIAARNPSWSLTLVYVPANAWLLARMPKGKRRRDSDEAAGAEPAF